VLKSIKTNIRKLIKKSGWELVRSSILTQMLHGIPTDYDVAHADTYQKVKDYTMTNSQRIVAICNATDYLTKNNIEGDIVGCGIWRGGAIMAAIDSLQKNEDVSREIYLYDTFEGMTTPAHQYDIKKGGNSGLGKTAEELYKTATAADLIFCYSSLEEVKQNIESLNYPAGKIHYVKGMVEDTIPKIISQKIALLYFNICFYESTLHALKYLFPLLVPGGVIIIGDYGDWEGTRKAVDEYIEINKIRLLLNRIDQTGRVGIKADPLVIPVKTL